MNILFCFFLSFLTFLSMSFEMFFLWSFPLLTEVIRSRLDLSESLFNLSAADLFLINVIDEKEKRGTRVYRVHLLLRALGFLGCLQISCSEEGLLQWSDVGLNWIFYLWVGFDREGFLFGTKTINTHPYTSLEVHTSLSSPIAQAYHTFSP